MKSTCINALFCTSWAVVCLLVSTPKFGNADEITVDQLSDLMIDNQGLNAEFIGRFFGPDENSPLVFSSNVNFPGLSFLFSLAPTMYLGQNLMLMGTGVFDPATNLLTLSSAGLFGSRAWTTAGTGVVTISPDNLFTDVDADFFESGILRGDVISETIERGGGATSDFSVATLENGEVDDNTVISSDQRMSTGTWTYQSIAELGYTVSSIGFTPPTGGPGSFTTTIAPVPEPASTVLIGSTALAIVIAGKGRTRLKRSTKSSS